jgi:signal transduction histidine kinase
VQSLRPITTLPLDFWLQCAVALACMLVGSWVWALRPHDAAASLFALSGLCVLLFALAAACYSSRNLALPQADFEMLAALNRFGATAYGFAAAAFFLRYPFPLLALPWLWGFLFAQIGIHLAMAAGWLPQFATQAITGVQMLAMLMLIAVQGWLCRKHPVERAALTWLGLSVALGAGGFVALQVFPILLGHEPLASQGMSFIFFLLPYIGTALGLTRYRLFDVGDWAFRLLFFMLGAVLLLLLDAAFIWALNWSGSEALGAALLLLGFGYLPLRDGLQRRLFRRSELPRSELFARAMGVAFAPDVAQRQLRWEDLLQKIFRPLRIERGVLATDKVQLQDDGLALTLPAVAGLSALRLWQAEQGRGLFNQQQAQLADRLLDLLAQAQTSREAYERGVQAERLRVAQDLHDDIGARLLTVLHSADAPLRPLLQETLAEVRGIAQGLAETGASLEVLLPELRQEAARRCEAAGLQLDWPPAQTLELIHNCPCPEAKKHSLDYRARRALVSVLREAISNALKHAQAQRIVVRYYWRGDGQALIVDVADDGQGLPATGAQPDQGMGMAGLQRRLQRLGGQVQWLPADNYAFTSGTLLRMELPLPAMLGGENR